MLIDIQMHCDEQNYVDTNAVTDPGWGLKAFYGTLFFGRALAGVSVISRKQNFSGLRIQWNLFIKDDATPLLSYESSRALYSV